MCNTIERAGAVTMLTWNSDQCPACGGGIRTVEPHNIRVAWAILEVVYYTLCKACQATIDFGEPAAFGTIIRAAESSVQAALIEADLETLEQAREEGRISPLVH